MQEKVLVLDIDGTLTNSKKEITEATKQGIWNILQHGHKVILASGRPTPGMRKCEEELELKNTADIFCPLMEPVSWNVKREKWSIREHCPCPLYPDCMNSPKRMAAD